jgi:uncharacterized protein YkwD
MTHAVHSRFGIPALLVSGLALSGAAGNHPRAETVNYAGKVVDGKGAGIPWVFLKVEGSDLIGQSGADGSFSLTVNVAATFYADPRPSSPFAQEIASQAPPIRFLLTGRATAGSYVAATMLLTAPAGDGPGAKSLILSPSARARFRESPEPRPPLPPVLSKSGASYASHASYTLTATMAHYQKAGFPQDAATAKNLVLTLTPSTTDTAVYAAEKKLCLDTINALRATLGLKSVAWSASLEAFADQGARYDAERNAAHGHFSAFSKQAVPSDAENAIPGWSLKNSKTVAKVVADGAKMMWDEGPGGGHYENIKGSHAAVGCGIYVTAAGAVWVIHDFK